MAAPIVSLCAKLKEGQADKPPAGNYKQSREYLQSVAVFEELTEHDSSVKAFGGRRRTFKPASISYRSIWDLSSERFVFCFLDRLPSLDF